MLQAGEFLGFLWAWLRAWLTILWVNAWPYTERDKKDDGKLRVALAARITSPELIAAVNTLTGNSFNTTTSAEILFASLNALITENPVIGAERLEANNASPEPDPWAFLFTRLRHDQGVLKKIIAAGSLEERNEILSKETQLSDRLSERTPEQLYALQQKAGNLLFAHARKAQRDAHRALATANTASGRYIRSSLASSETQIAKLVEGFRFWNHKWYSAAIFFFVLFGILVINTSTEYWTYTANEFSGVSRNGSFRPRSLDQIYVAIFVFHACDVQYLWEIGRQRSLGASLTYIAYAYAHFDSEIYGKTEFVVGVAIGAVAFQLLVQLYDIAWENCRLWWTKIDDYPEYTAAKFLYVSFRANLPRKLGYKAYPATATAAENARTYADLKLLNLRTSTWIDGFAKSKATSVAWMMIANPLAIPASVFASRAGITNQTVYDAKYFMKLGLTSGCMIVGAFSAFCFGYRQKWQSFNIILGFYVATTVKMYSLTRKNSQEVRTVNSVFCNMVAGNTSPLVFTLLLSVIKPEWFESPDVLKWNLPLNFVVGLWTDQLGEAMQKVGTRYGKLKARR